MPFEWNRPLACYGRRPACRHFRRPVAAENGLAARSTHFPCLRSRFLASIGWLAGLLLCLFCEWVGLGAEPPEGEAAYGAALKSFQTQFYERATQEFANFAEQFPTSSKVPEAVLLQAQSLFKLKDYDAVIALLSRRATGAGPLQDQYAFWRAEAEFYRQASLPAARQNFDAAIKAYEALLTTFTNSALRLEASYGQAWSCFKVPDYDRTIRLLSDPAGAFQKAAAGSTNETIVARGYLLLGEAHFNKKDYSSAEQVMIQLGGRKLPPELDWERRHLRALSAKARQKPDDALKAATELVALASNTNLLNKPNLQASSLILLGDILRDKDPRDPDPAIAAYDQITKIKGIPPSQNEQALLRIIELLVSHQRFTNAIHRLDALLSQTNQETPVALIRLTMGELYLKQFYALATTAPSGLPRTIPIQTNLLHQARTNFVQLIAAWTNSPLLGKAYLNQGWCLWEEAQLTDAPSKFAESQAAFKAATEHPLAEDDQAIARLKLADCQFRQRDYTNAVQNYRFVIDRYSQSPEIRNKWLDQAFSQIVRTSLESGDLAGAGDALERLLEQFPLSEFTARSVLNYAAELLNRARASEARQAREALLKFQKRAVSSAWLPDAQLAVARSFIAETNWPAALREFDQWLAQHTNHSARPQAFFDKALTYYRAGYETNALASFTNFISLFPTNALAPWAQLWVGDFYYNNQAYTNAERNYQLIFRNTNTIPLELRCEAGLRAGQAALLRDKPSEARGYVTNLFNNYLNPDTNRPSEIEAQAYYLLGEIELKEVPAPGLTNSLVRFERALVPFQKIVDFHPTNRLAPMARGKIADCSLQLSAQDPKWLDLARTNYVIAMNSPAADVNTRSQAEVGLAKVLKAQAEPKPASEQKQLRRQALEHCLNVAHGCQDPFWASQAALEAAKLAEELEMTAQAAKLYERLLREFPQLLSLQPNLRKRLDELRDGETK
ncbi:MAG: tetratricopeptide repeat protein [Verrucomicrobia bacterium]|nr:tetratricopeptide repeat protein [Verrucomicrobiota bacterium]